MLFIPPNHEPDPMLTLCGGQLLVDVDFEPPAEDFDDNVKISFREDCPPDWKLFKTSGAIIGLTSAEARALSALLLAAAKRNDAWLKGRARR